MAAGVVVLGPVAEVVFGLDAGVLRGGVPEVVGDEVDGMRVDLVVVVVVIPVGCLVRVVPVGMVSSQSGLYVGLGFDLVVVVGLGFDLVVPLGFRAVLVRVEAVVVVVASSQSGLYVGLGFDLVVVVGLDFDLVVPVGFRAVLVRVEAVVVVVASSQSGLYVGLSFDLVVVVGLDFDFLLVPVGGPTGAGVPDLSRTILRPAAPLADEENTKMD
jgi:hypothetical protein